MADKSSTSNDASLFVAVDDAKTKLVASSTQKVSVLSEISIFTTGKEGSTPLLDVLKKVRKDFADNIGVHVDSDPKELRAFLKSVLPEYDEAKVYVSDMRKLVRWYGILAQYAQEIFE